LFPDSEYNPSVRTADFDYVLPPELIAQTPAAKRDQSRLLVFQRPDGLLNHRGFRDLLDYLRAGDLLVLNDSRVIPARLRGRNSRTGGGFEVLLLEENAVNDWWVMLRPGKRARLHTRIELLNRHGEVTGISATVSAINDQGHRRLQFSGTGNIADQLCTLGEIPLPPYIRRLSPEETVGDEERYQTVYAAAAGSVAAPTAGLHFTAEFLDQVQRAGVQVCRVTLHVGLGTFAPVKAEELSGHVMHDERFFISEETANAVNAARREHRRIIAVGTTSVRVLESAADVAGQISAQTGRTRIFIHPPFRFKIVDALLTNFHLPCSTLLMLVSALAAPGETSGRDLILSAYAEAIRERYRFFSYGDAMLIL
jgi:S-adenosylmethionine:tRNA ribosyltransferase-isomerase